MNAGDENEKKNVRKVLRGNVSVALKDKYEDAEEDEEEKVFVQGST